METDFGVIALKELFSSQVKAEGAYGSGAAARAAIRSILEQQGEDYSDRQIAELLRQKFFRFFGMEAVNVDLLCAEGSPKPLRGSVLEPGINVGNILPFIQPALIQAFARTGSVPEVLEIVEKH